MAHLRNINSKCDRLDCNARSVVEVVSDRNPLHPIAYCRKHGTAALSDADARDREAKAAGAKEVGAR